MRLFLVPPLKNYGKPVSRFFAGFPGNLRLPKKFQDGLLKFGGMLVIGSDEREAKVITHKLSQWLMNERRALFHFAGAHRLSPVKYGAAHLFMGLNQSCSCGPGEKNSEDSLLDWPSKEFLQNPNQFKSKDLRQDLGSPKKFSN